MAYPPACAGPTSCRLGPTNYLRLRCLVFKEHDPVPRPLSGLAFVHPKERESRATDGILPFRMVDVKQIVLETYNPQISPPLSTDSTDLGGF